MPQPAASPIPAGRAATTDRWIARYLALLGLAPEAPSVAALERLVRAHVLTVPFENVTAVLRRADHPDGPVPPLDFDVLLGSWERGRGGVCFEIAGMLGRLLMGLGYAAEPVLGQISFPGSHQAIVVHLAGRRYLVDVGNGAPIFAPIALDEPVEVHSAGLGYRFRTDPTEDADGEHVQDRLIDGTWTPFCRYVLRPSTAEERELAYQHHHTLGPSWVVSTLTVVRCRAGAVDRLRNDELVRYTTSGKETTSVARADLGRVLTETFGLADVPIDRLLASLARAGVSFDRSA